MLALRLPALDLLAESGAPLLLGDCGRSLARETAQDAALVLLPVAFMLAWWARAPIALSGAGALGRQCATAPYSKAASIFLCGLVQRQGSFLVCAGPGREQPGQLLLGRCSEAVQPVPMNQGSSSPRQAEGLLCCQTWGPCPAGQDTLRIALLSRLERPHSHCCLSGNQHNLLGRMQAGQLSEVSFWEAHALLVPIFQSSELKGDLQFALSLSIARVSLACPLLLCGSAGLSAGR